MGFGRLQPLARVVWAAGLAILWFGAPTAGALDWSAVPGKDVAVFHAGQASWEWLLTKSDHSAATKMREGKSCQDCHRGEERTIGELIASGEKLEPTPRPAGRAFSLVTVQAAHDGEKLRMRFSWPAGAERSRLALLLDDGAVKEMNRGGCFATCHADLAGMPHAEGADRTKYLMQSRTRIRRSGGGDDWKPAGELAAMLQAGQFLELWEIEARPAQAAKAAHGGWVLAERNENAAPGISVDGRREGSRWIAEIARPLRASGAHEKTLAPGRTYTFGIAIHDGKDEGRFHRVSLEQTLTIDRGEADFVARKQ